MLEDIACNWILKFYVHTPYSLLLQLLSHTSLGSVRKFVNCIFSLVFIFFPLFLFVIYSSLGLNFNLFITTNISVPVISVCQLFSRYPLGSLSIYTMFFPPHEGG